MRVSSTLQNPREAKDRGKISIERVRHYGLYPNTPNHQPRAPKERTVHVRESIYQTNAHSPTACFFQFPTTLPCNDKRKGACACTDAVGMLGCVKNADWGVLRAQPSLVMQCSISIMFFLYVNNPTIFVIAVSPAPSSVLRMDSASRPSLGPKRAVLLFRLLPSPSLPCARQMLVP
jgi:hypothetical protein